MLSGRLFSAEEARAGLGTQDDDDEPEDEDPIPLCATCGAPVGIFPEVALNWRHFRGAPAASGIHETYDPGHPSEVAWYLPNEAAEEF